MKRAIITPTYIGHFKYIQKYLKSFKKYLLNKDFPIFFIIEKSERQEFNKIVKPYLTTLNLNIVYLEDIFERYGIIETPKEIFKKYGRLSFQTLKKLYGGLYSGADEFFFLDSESMLIKPVDMNKVFDAYFETPTFFVSKVEDRHQGYKDTFVYNYICTVSKILNIEPDYWTVDSYEWFYKRTILEDLINELGQPIDIVKSYIPTGKFPDLEGILEALLYYLFVLKHNDKYRYKINYVQDEFQKYLGKEQYNKFRKNFDENLNLNIAGLYELCTYYFDSENVNGFENLFKDNNIQVMRFTAPNNNYCFQSKIINNTNISILPSEQEHLFGINATIFNIICYRKNAINQKQQLLKHVNKFFEVKPLEIFSIIFYFIKLVHKLLNGDKQI